MRKINQFKGEKKVNRVEVRLSDRDKERLDSLCQLTGKSASELIVNALKFSSGNVQRQHLKDFIAKVELMEDPFDIEDQGVGYCQFLAERSVDESDRLLAEQTINLPLDAPMPTTSDINAYLERIFWLMDETATNIPPALLPAVHYWRNNQAAIKSLRHP